jgi:hypothetical protein
VKALLIPVDGPPREVDLPGGGTRFMRSLKALIGTQCAERIQITSRWEAWLDEDGAAAGKPVNQAATLVARSFGCELSLLGAVVIVGVDKDTAEPAGLSPAQAGAILEKIRAPSADDALVKAAVQHGREGEHVQGVAARGGPGNLRSMGGRVAESAEQALHQGLDPVLLRVLPVGGQGVEPDLRAGRREATWCRPAAALETQAGHVPQPVGDRLRATAVGLREQVGKHDRTRITTTGKNAG